jgi:glycosyltransferase involved in cell wall biosynthesis
VVATRVGAEGMDLRHGVHALIADGPEDFARAVTSLLRDPALRASISRNAIETVRQRWSPEVVEGQLAGILTALERLAPKRPTVTDWARRLARAGLRCARRVGSIGVR